MPRLTALHWKILARIFENDGFVFRQQTGSHRVYIKKGNSRPIVIPTYDNVDKDIILGLMRTAGMSRERFLKLLNQSK